MGSSKVLIWLASGDMEKLKPGILYGINALKYDWVEDVKFVVFGASEGIIPEDTELFDQLENTGNTSYCKYIADDMGITEKLEKKGVKMIYVGDYISNLIKEGYQVITF